MWIAVTNDDFGFKKIEESKTDEQTPEDELAEKLRVKKLQEDSDLELANEAFGEYFSIKATT